VFVAVGVAVCDGVGVWEAVGVALAVAVCVGVGDGDGLGVSEAVGVSLGKSVGAGVEAGLPRLQASAVKVNRPMSMVRRKPGFIAPSWRT
jgi:hypothetical protein